MQFFGKSQEENEITSIIVDVNGKNQYGQILHILKGEWLSQILRQPEVDDKSKFKIVKVYDLMSITNEKSDRKELTYERQAHLSKH